MTPKRWILTAISFLLAFWVSASIIRPSWSQEGARVGLPLWAHAACLAAACVEVLARAIKIRLGAAALRIPLGLPTSLRVALGGDFGGSITPARSGSEPSRFLILREAGLPVANALVVLFIELFFETLSLATLALGLAFVFGGSTMEVRSLAGMVAGYSTVVLGTGVSAYIVSKRWASGPPPAWLQRFHVSDQRWHAVQRTLTHLRRNVTRMRRARWPLMAASFAFSLLHILMRLVVLPIVVLALGVRAPLGPLVLWPLAIIYGGAVAPVPAGGGLIEVAFRGALNEHIPARIFGAALLWWRVYTFYILLVGGAVVAGAAVMRSLRRNTVADMVMD